MEAIRDTLVNIVRLILIVSVVIVIRCIVEGVAFIDIPQYYPMTLTGLVVICVFDLFAGIFRAIKGE
jgi:hypothetical protein